jgi:competence protein ComEA
MSSALVKALCFSALLAAGARLLPARAEGELLPEGPGRDTTQKVCGECHGVEVFTGIRRSRATWETTIENMIGFGATISDGDFETVATYLTTYLGPAPRPAPAP